MKASGISAGVLNVLVKTSGAASSPERDSRGYEIRAEADSGSARQPSGTERTPRLDRGSSTGPGMAVLPERQPRWCRAGT